MRAMGPKIDPLKGTTSSLGNKTLITLITLSLMNIYIHSYNNPYNNSSDNPNNSTKQVGPWDH